MKKITTSILIITYFLVLPYLSHVKADCGLSLPGGYQVTAPGNCTLTDPGMILGAFLPYIFGIAGFITIIMIVISGIQFITSSGNPEAAGAARGRLVFALIGFAVIVLSFVILKLIEQVFLGTSVVS